MRSQWSLRIARFEAQGTSPTHGARICTEEDRVRLGWGTVILRRACGAATEVPRNRFGGSEPCLHRGRVALDTPRVLFALLFTSRPQSRKKSAQVRSEASQARACNHEGAGPGSKRRAEKDMFWAARHWAAGVVFAGRCFRASQLLLPSMLSAKANHKPLQEGVPFPAW